MSQLDSPPARFVDQPFYSETVEVLRCVRDRDFTALSELCDDDFGIVDGDPSGAAATDYVTTIIWKRTPDGWREARWHGSVVSSVIPDVMLPDPPAPPQTGPT